MLIFILDTLEGISGFIIAYFIYKIVGNILTMRRNHWALSLILMIAYSFVGTTIIYPEEVTGTFAAFILFVITTMLIYNDHIVVKISTVFILYPIAVSLSYLTKDFGFVIWYYIFKQSLSLEAQTLLSLCFNLLSALLWYLAYRGTRNWISQISEELTLRMWLVIDTISMTSCIGIITIIYNTTIMSSYIAYPACIACILTSVGVCYLCSYISKTLKSEMEVQALKYQQNYYQELENNQNTIKKLRHDMKNHLNIIGTFLRDQNIDQAINYLADFSSEFDVNIRPFCNNSVVNAVLNTKYHLAVEHNIDCNIQVDINDSLPLDDISLCSLLSNTLDNAIEAGCKISTDKPRWIELKARIRNGRFSYEITNSKTNNVRYRHKTIITDKEDASEHGIGLKTITEIINKHHGHLEISHTDKVFSLTVLI